MKMKIEEANVDGFLSPQENGGYYRYAAPCVFYGSPLPREAEGEVCSPLFTPMKANSPSNLSTSFMSCGVIWTGQAEKKASHDDECVHVRPGGAGKEQGDHRVPDELRPVAGQDHTAVVLPHCAERHPRFRHVLHVEVINDDSSTRAQEFQISVADQAAKPILSS
jgi:hypothetical protein